MFLEIIMNIWENILFKVHVVVPTYRGIRRGHQLSCIGYPSAQGHQDKKAGVMDLSQEIQFWGWESFPWAQHSPWANATTGSYAVRALGRCSGLCLDAESSCHPCCGTVHISPSHGQNESGSWLTWRKQGATPIASAGTRLLVECSKATVLLGQAVSNGLSQTSLYWPE